MVQRGAHCGAVGMGEVVDFTVVPQFTLSLDVPSSRTQAHGLLRLGFKAMLLEPHSIVFITSSKKSGCWTNGKGTVCDAVCHHVTLCDAVLSASNVFFCGTSPFELV